MNDKEYGLTFPQKNIWLVDKFNNNTSINVITGLIDIKDVFDENICKEAINNVIKNNDAMRITLIDNDAEPLQKINEYRYNDVETVDMSLCSKEEIKVYINDFALQSISLSSKALYDFKILKYNDNNGCILMRIHHIISDAWSCSQITTQMIEYLESKNLNEIDLQKPSYIEFIKSQKEYEESEKFTNNKEFWENYLNGIDESVSLNKGKTKKTTKADRFNTILDYEFTNSIMSFCKDNQISPYVLFLTAISTYIYRIKDLNDFVLGTPVLNRSNFKEKKTMGMFVSTVPIRVKVQEDVEIIELAQNISKDLRSIFRHQKYPYSKTLEYVRKNTNIESNLYNIVVSYQNARSDIKNKEIYNTDWIFSRALEDELQIHIMDMDSTGLFVLNYDYLVDIYDRVEIEYLHSRLMEIIKNIINKENVTVENIEIMSDSEKRTILKDFNNTKTDYPSKKTVIELFEEQVNMKPDKIALSFENEQITYSELNSLSNKIANFLINEKGVKPNDVIGVFMDKSNYSIVSILACLKCGAIYLPIDISSPNERLQYILENSSCKIVLTNNITIGDIDNVEFLEIKEIEKSNHAKSNIVRNTSYNYDNVAYIMYTSGTTGTPKGVKVTNRNIVRLVKNTNYIEFFDDDNMIQTGTLSFDASTFEIFGALLNGLSLYLISKDDLLNISAFEKHVLSNKITIMWLTSPLFNQIVDYNIDVFKNIRVLLVGGDVLSPKHINKVKTAYPDLQIINGYGPTENTTFSACYNISKEDKANIPIGKPISNSTCYIVDKKNRLLPLFVEGELLVGGDGVSKGYLNYNQKLDNKFIQNPFELGKNAYKTGDITFWDDKGNISFVGRKDGQMKIRGYRVELTEIKNILLLHPDIKDCYISVDIKDNKKHIVCLYTTSINVEQSEIIEFLKSKLPYYMVPQVFIKIEEFILNKNGKVDISKINQIIEKNKKSDLNSKVENSNIYNYEGVYKDLYELFKEALQKPEIGIDDNFFEIGGDSLIAIQLIMNAVSKKIKITINDLYKNPSIKQLGDFLRNKNPYVSISRDIDDFDYSNIDKILQNNTNLDNIKTSGIGNVLLTGVTGFLGAHILDEFMKNETGKIYCLIRNKDNRSIKERITERLEFFFGNKYDKEIGKRIILINGDMEKASIIDSQEDYHIIKNNVDTIINSAANVRHYGYMEKFESVNISAVNNLIEFCLQNNKKLIHISTLSVSGNILETGQVEQVNIKPNTKYSEKNLYIGQNLDNVYAYTKFMGEKLILDAIATYNLNAKIMRMGNLTGRQMDGRFQPNVSENAFANRLKTFFQLNIIPENLLDFYLEFTPIDYAAQAIIKLSSIDNEYNVFHLFNHNHVPMVEAVEIFKKIGINLNIIKKEEMTKLIEEFSAKKDQYDKIQGIILDTNNKNEIEYKPNVIIKSDFTIAELQKMNFKWPIIDQKYIERYLKYLIDIGFLNIDNKEGV